MTDPALPDLRTFLLTNPRAGAKNSGFSIFGVGTISAFKRGVVVRLYQPHHEGDAHDAAFVPSPRTGFRNPRLLGVSSRGGQRRRAINDVFAFKGTATDIGVQRGPGQIGGIEYRIEGKFEYDGPLDLTKSTVTFHRFLDEYRRAGMERWSSPPTTRTWSAQSLPATVLATCVVAHSLLFEQQQEDRGQVRDAGPVPAADARADQEQGRGVPVQRPARPGPSPQVLLPGRRPTRAPSRGSSVPEALRRRSSRQDQARKDGHPHQLHDLRRRERRRSCSTS